LKAENMHGEPLLDQRSRALDVFVPADDANGSV
jgi:hypothetical protein